jgi:hypothetical protein
MNESQIKKVDTIIIDNMGEGGRKRERREKRGEFKARKSEEKLQSSFGTNFVLFSLSTKKELQFSQRPKEKCSLCCRLCGG